MLFKQRLELGNVLNDDGNADIPGAHGGQQLVEIIRQAHVGELIHEKMHRYGQATAVYPVGRIKKFLESAGIQQTYQEIEAGVVVRDEGKECHFFFFSPRLERSSSSVAVRAATEERLNFSRRDAKVIWMDFSVLAEPER